MNLTTFNDLYTGYALVLNETIPEAQNLTEEQMKNIKGLWISQRMVGGWYEPGHIEWRPYKIVIDKWIPYPWISFVVTRWLGPIPIQGYWKYETRYYHLRYSRVIKIPYYVPGKFHPIYIRRMMTDETARKHVKTQIDVISLVGSVGGIGVAKTAATKAAAIVATGASSAQFGLDIPSRDEIYHAFMDPYVEVDFDGYVIPIRPGL